MATVLLERHVSGSDLDWGVWWQNPDYYANEKSYDFVDEDGYIHQNIIFRTLRFSFVQRPNVDVTSDYRAFLLFMIENVDLLAKALFWTAEDAEKAERLNHHWEIEYQRCIK